MGHGRGGCRVRSDDWTNLDSVCGKYQASNLSWLFRVTNGGLLVLTASNNGTTTEQVDSGTATGFTDGTFGWVRFVFSGGDVDFYTSSDTTNDDTEVTWSLLGQSTFATITSLYDGSAPIEIGSYSAGTGDPADGCFAKVVIYDTGVKVGEFDPTRWTTGTTLDSSTGETWTLNGNAFIQNTGHDVVRSIGLAGLETTAGQTISGDVTVFLVGLSSETPAANSFFFDSRSLSAARMAILTEEASADAFAIFQGDTIVDIASSFDNLPHVFTGEFRGDATTTLTVSNVGSVSGNSGADNWDFGSIFIANGASAPLTGWIGQLVVFDRQLTGGEVLAVQSYLRSKFGV